MTERFRAIALWSSRALVERYLTAVPAAGQGSAAAE
jgi:hypothetical protein